jgi:hypothetical protein|tara:strand:- start:293 stop:622 length:330 start_codon:yes stop_codon:yes gene_type:complete
MTKKGRLSKQEQSYIAEHIEEPVSDIAVALDRSEAVVSKQINKIQDSPVDFPRAGEFMARNEKYGAVTMTEQASMLGDESKAAQSEAEKEKEVNVAQRHRAAIHKIKEK